MANHSQLRRVNVAAVNFEVLAAMMKQAVACVDAMEDLNIGDQSENVHPITKRVATESLGKSARLVLHSAIEEADRLAGGVRQVTTRDRVRRRRSKASRS